MYVECIDKEARRGWKHTDNNGTKQFTFYIRLIEFDFEIEFQV